MSRPPGFHHTPQTRAKMSAANRGKTHTPETRAKLSAAHRGSNSLRWKGGVTVDSEGYRWLLLPHHPTANRKGYIRENRLVMERVIGRYLLPQEVVHHDDENKLNNAAYNLILFPDQAAHTRYHNLKRQSA